MGKTRFRITASTAASSRPGTLKEPRGMDTPVVIMPMPTMSEAAAIMRLRFSLKSTLASTSSDRPLPEMSPNSRNDTPPSTQLGME